MQVIDHRKRQVALHEAAHAVTAQAFGMTVARATIVPDGEAEGRVEYERMADGPQGIVALLAGAEGERLGASWHMGDDGSSGDRDRAYACIHEAAVSMGVDRTALLDACQSAARRIVSKNREAIKRLADALLEHGTLSGSDLRAIVGPGTSSWRLDGSGVPVPEVDALLKPKATRRSGKVECDRSTPEGQRMAREFRHRCLIQRGLSMGLTREEATKAAAEPLAISKVLGV